MRDASLGRRHLVQPTTVGVVGEVSDHAIAIGDQLGLATGIVCDGGDELLRLGARHRGQIVGDCQESCARGHR